MPDVLAKHSLRVSIVLASVMGGILTVCQAAGLYFGKLSVFPGFPSS